VRHGRGLAGAVALSCAAAVAGCGFGPGDSSEGTATLTVTRDYGSRALLETADRDPPGSETVIRMLDREAEITTRYGGGFVQSIDGLAGGSSGGRRSDWFFYVNGVESDRGAAQVGVRGGDRIWWDYRDWSDAMRVPAVVGSWPEPFAQGSSVTGRRLPVTVDCATERPICATVAKRLTEEGAEARIERGASGQGGRSPRLVVGPWGAIRGDFAAALGGPQASGVFATFGDDRPGGYELRLTNSRAEPACAYRAGAGLVAAVEAGGSDRATWLVTGTDRAGVRRAAEALDPGDLRDRYAVAVPRMGSSLGVPVDPGRGCAGGPTG
jgi:Domain of unknown function (DUF4430)